jgi:hypothetical protein
VFIEDWLNLIKSLAKSLSLENVRKAGRLDHSYIYKGRGLHHPASIFGL